jgi:hypothetical protein
MNTEEKAAKIYDRLAILTHGLRAKTNYSYSKAQIINILDREHEILSHDLYDGYGMQGIPEDETFEYANENLTEIGCPGGDSPDKKCVCANNAGNCSVESSSSS